MSKIRTKIQCACGGKCDGICREKHLRRKRKNYNVCPSAYGDLRELSNGG